MEESVLVHTHVSHEVISCIESYMLTDLITTENTAMYDDCFCVFNGRRKLCHGNSCHGTLEYDNNLELL